MTFRRMTENKLGAAVGLVVLFGLILLDGALAVTCGVLDLVRGGGEGN